MKDWDTQKYFICMAEGGGCVKDRERRREGENVRSVNVSVKMREGAERKKRSGMPMKPRQKEFCPQCLNIIGIKRS